MTPRKPNPTGPAVRLRGARQNNLKNLDLDIPLNRLIVVTGVSGSGKSSLAFDTLYAEGQRRYVETFSPYARQFMDRMDRPAADLIEGIPPSVAIDRKDPVRTSRSTVGTMTEITDYVKLMFARMAVLHCPGCGRPVQCDTPGAVWRRIKGLEWDTPLVITFPWPLDPASADTERTTLGRMGYDRIWWHGQVRQLDEVAASDLPRQLDVVADRFRLRADRRRRAIDSAEQAFRFGAGRLSVHAPSTATMHFSARLACARCNIAYPLPVTNLFSFNSPAGACPTCRGFGRVIDIDPDLIVPDPGRSLAQGAVKPFGGRMDGKPEYDDLAAFCRRRKIPMDRPFRELKPQWRQAIEEGGDGYYGIRGYFKWLEGRTYKMHVRVFLSRYRSYDRCTACDGTRFRPEALAYRLADRTIADIYSLDVDGAAAFCERLALPPGDEAARLVASEIRSRLTYLQQVGLGFLTLDRQSRTLSGGEVQRVALTSALGANLVNTLYVLDEPSIGLHPRDSNRLVQILHRLRSRPNSVVVVEHDPEIIRHSDWLLDMGPRAGEKGGRVMYFGPLDRADGSLTADYLTGRCAIPVPPARRRPVAGREIVIRGAAEHNLKEIDVALPLGLMVCLTGVSGSGKSTLAEEVLYRAIKRAHGGLDERPGRHAAVDGLDRITDVVLVNQHPIGRTPRANLLTYTGAMTHLRNLLAATPEARRRRLKPGFFSFNVPGGRCETCRGEGFEKVEMQFLSDVFITCAECDGRRFGGDVLEIQYQGRNLHEILSLTVDQAFAFFAHRPRIAKALAPLTRVGLGYMRLGQPLNTLSGGEAQRLKLSRHLQAGTDGATLFVFDEPTTGLHFEDIAKLLAVFHDLADRGHTLLVVEHNLDVIKSADWVIDLGPEGGDGGGRIVVAGPPEAVAGCSRSHTGRFLKTALEPGAYSSPAETVPAVAEPVSAEEPAIAVTGAREHNLKNVDLTIPRDAFVVLTGVSGSGKSSLAFDILFAEGQRRYLESLAPYVRQYVKVLERPDVDRVAGLPPTVAIEQRISHAGRRSTVATLTEVYHFLRLLFSKTGTQHCPGCSRPLAALSQDRVLEGIRHRFGRRKLQVLAPKVAGRKGFHKTVLAAALKKGFTRARIDGTLTDIVPDMALSRYHTHTIEPVVGSLPGRNAAAIVDTALSEGGGNLVVLAADGSEAVFSLQGVCPDCGIGLKPLDPRLFSFNSIGACPRCQGLGSIAAAGRAGRGRQRNAQAPPGVCPDCNGTRLNPEARSVRVDGISLPELTALPAERAGRRLAGMNFDNRQRPVADPILAELTGRLGLLGRLGVGYLTLDRCGDTLSGGEAQRIRLAAQLGSNLTGVAYILDEPTIGLHPRDNRRLIDALRDLQRRGNSILVVEHDEETIREADHVIDLGPGAGRHGGEMVATGTLSALRRNRASVTGRWLDGKRPAVASQNRDYRDRPAITVEGASANNLKAVSAGFPLNTLIAVTGVSGSGKSSLLNATLFQAVHRLLAGDMQPANGNGLKVSGWRQIDRILEVDHQPIGRTPRSVPASYVGFLGNVRQLFARVPEARARGYTPGRFSFNVAGGRCEACKGQGRPKVEMSFLPDVYVPCGVCGGSRFNTDTLAVRYRGSNIAEVLQMTFNQAAGFFEAVPAIRKPIAFVRDIGLGYLQLGQPSPTLSGGEAQRIKLASQLARPANGKTFYVLDEPTTGLHPSDVRQLLTVLQALVTAGNTVAVIEHNLDVIRAADYVIDLGPEGGDRGGQIVAAGSPDEILNCTNDSHTARWLEDHVRKRS